MGYAMCCDGEYSCVLYQVKHLQLSILKFRMRQLQTIFTGGGNRYCFCLEMWRGVAQFLVLEDWEDTLIKHYDACKENNHIFDYYPLQDNWIRMCWIQNLKKMMAIRNCQKLTAKYAKLLSHLPHIGFDVYACIDLDAIERRAAWLLVKLLELHRGEVVQISHHENAWELMTGRCPEPWNPQLFFGEEELESPNQSKQKFLCVRPYDESDELHLRLKSKCSTLGHMFEALGKDYAASTIYGWYLSREVLVQKLPKPTRRKSLSA